MNLEKNIYRREENKGIYSSMDIVLFLTMNHANFNLYDIKVWTLLCDLSFWDDLSHNSGWTHGESNRTPWHARPVYTGPSLQ